MTIEFNCPHCDGLMAFADQHAGKGAKCSTCGQHLIIPDENFAKPQGLAEEEPDRGEPLPGFYRAAFAEGWGLFFRLGNVVPLMFIVAVVCFKFFIAHVDYSFTAGGFRVYLPIGLLVRGICWGCLFWYYLEIINNTVLSDDTCELPEIEIDGYSGFFANALRSVWVIAMALVICILPAKAADAFLGSGSPGVVSTMLANVGLFILPMLILAVAVTRDSTQLVRFDLSVPPLLKTFLPYLSVALLIVILAQLQFRAKNYGDSAVINASALVKTSWLLAQLGLQILAIIGARALGLLHRHYECFFSMVAGWRQWRVASSHPTTDHGPTDPQTYRPTDPKTHRHPSSPRFPLKSHGQPAIGGRSQSEGCVGRSLCEDPQGGKSGQDRARWWLTATGSNPRESAAETIPPIRR